MGRLPLCDETVGLKKGPWTPEEDEVLINYIHKHGHGSWRGLPKLAGLNRCGKSCRLRWINYLRPDIKRGKFSQEEEQTILNLHAVLGNKWSAIATHLPGRTDNEIKNFWNTHLKKKLIQMGFDPMTHRPRTDIVFSSLSQLMALANLKGLMDQQLRHPLEEQSIMKLQTEITKFQYLQHLLQPPSMNSINFNDIIKDNSTGNLDLRMFDLCLNEFNNLPELETLHSAQETASLNNGVLDLIQAPPSDQIGQSENPPMSPIWLSVPSSLTESQPCAVPHVTENPKRNNDALEDGCCSTTSAIWPDFFLEDSLLHYIP